MSHRNRRWKGRAPQAPAQEMFERALRNEKDSDSKRFDPREDRKTLQLCRQVHRALMLALAGECADELLRDIYVDSVEPMGSASQLLVRVVLPSGALANSMDVLARLNDRAPRLRAIVAQSICRKRAPGLTFVVVASTMQMPEGGLP